MAGCTKGEDDVEVNYCTEDDDEVEPCNPFSDTPASYWNEDPQIPFLYEGRCDLSFEEKVVILWLDVDSSRVCNRRPLQFQGNGGFVFDRSAFKGGDDWLSTDLGSFVNKGYSGRIITLRENAIADSIRLPRRVQDRPELKKGQYLVLTTYWKHAKYTDFCRNTTVVQRYDGSLLNHSLAQYFFTGEPHKVSPKKNRSNKPFHPTTGSTFRFIKDNARRPLGPGTVFDRAFEQAGGVIDVEAISDVPRNVQQIKNARQRLRMKKQKDEFQDLLSLSAENKDVKGLQWTPTPRVVLASQGQMDEICTNCCGPNATGVFSIDTTYNVGNFFVTATSYQNRMFIHKQTGRAANLPGPAMFHVKQDASQFHYFANILLEANYQFEQVRYIGGDRSQSQQAFLRPLKGAQFLPCKKHLEDDMTRKMSALGMEVAEQCDVLKDVFGSVEDGEKGLVDSSSSTEFEEKLKVLGAVWNRQFWDYFIAHVADDIKEGMSPQTRRTIGLKDDFYYNNALECQNFRYKQKIQEVKAENEPGVKTSQCSWVEAIEVYQNMVQETRNNIQRAVIGRGPFKLASEFSHFECSEERWRTMTPEERRKHLAKFDAFMGYDKTCTSEVILPMPSSDVIEDCPQSFLKDDEISICYSSNDGGFIECQDVQVLTLETSTTEAKQVSRTGADGLSRNLTPPSSATCTSSSTISIASTDVSSELSSLGPSLGEITSSKHIGQFKDSGLPDYLKGSWANAQTIIDKNGVGRFPGSQSKRVVISLSQGDTCHVVSISRSHVIQCDEKCPKYKMHKLCAHTIAVAFESGLLYDVCRNYKQSVSSMVQSLIPPRVGKKENERTARKRKSKEQYGNRDVSGLSNRTEVTVDDTSLTEGYEIVFIQDTSALGCYGCKGKVRQKPSDPVPGDPYDIFLRRKEYRAFRKRGSASTAVSISKQPEYVYYHPLKSCVPGKNIGKEIWAEASTKSNLSKTHKELIWREFGLQV